MLAWAFAIEKEAAERYTDLAGQMEVHNNLEVADLFRKLAGIEAKHVAQVEEMNGGRPPREISLWEETPWIDAESPEALAYDEAHYLMTPHQALELALQGECYAAEFFADVAASAKDETVRQMAEELAQEEREHVTLVEKWLARYPKPDRDWARDDDPPGEA